MRTLTPEELQKASAESGIPLGDLQKTHRELHDLPNLDYLPEGSKEGEIVKYDNTIWVFWEDKWVPALVAIERYQERLRHGT
jgi:hypothetical protein